MVSDADLGRQTTHAAIPHLVRLYPLVTMAITHTIPHMELPDYTAVVKVTAHTSNKTHNKIM